MRAGQETIRLQVRKKYSPESKLDVGQMRRLYGFARKGFRYEDIRVCLGEEITVESGEHFVKNNRKT
ncbi:MAG: hypothetical protein ACLTMW_07705 [Blautia hydrogenotrophica]